MNTTVESVWTIIQQDHLARYCAVFLVGSILLAIFALIFRLPIDLDISYLLLLIVIETYILYLRVGRIQYLVRNGIPVKGQVQGPYKMGGRNLIEYSYIYKGEQYFFRCFLRRGVDLGRNITVMIDPDRPDKSIIRDIFEG